MGSLYFLTTQALDREDDYDEVDAIATDTYQPRANRTDLCKDLEVLDDSVHEQRCSGDVTLHPPANPPHTGKRTRAAPATGGRSHGSATHPGQATTAALPGRVPDHVRNPHKYTCYPLDAPIVVGSGVLEKEDNPDVLRVGGQLRAGRADGGATSDEPSTGAQAGAAEQGSSKFQPVSGSGVIAFRSNRSFGGHDSVGGFRNRATIEMQEDDDEREQGAEAMEAMEAAPVTGQFRAAGQPKQRHLRGKTQ